MSAILMPRQTEQGWVVDLPPEMAQAIGVAEGSMVILYAHEGSVRTEILPPVSAEIKNISQYLLQKNRALYEEMKKVGDEGD
ncbi:MAG: hypothetical protein JST84_26585 [Acidobacteria bacterium]|nr:hypothetical protein [Acidobacteriota bacterium]